MPRVMISPEQRKNLSEGKEAAPTLQHALQIDFSVLLNTLTDNRARPLPDKAGFIEKMHLCAAALNDDGGIPLLNRLSQHVSDTVRGFAVFGLISHYKNDTPETLLEIVRPFAADPHFAVREWAWIAARPCLAASLTQSIKALTPWTADNDLNIRRFAVEVLRPRGVWCQHIRPLRENPEQGLPLLEPMRAETTRYAQDSVANWLNDAAKDQPEWVTALCRKWTEEAPENKATRRIVRRALRSLGPEKEKSSTSGEK
ncbi:DNA alkylation repair protein [Acetobacter thailandicus]|uniref:DNA alkylation repair protein n=1 Tax=Acetobacter thailandicus TaxID=1502842 RepID=UPI001BAB64A0|nr:DNA alkylation repair protein [Acetobacter thailandicus]MBS1002608.1 DNA alkylation repair protein [Acetobacter thailandicus]